MKTILPTSITTVDQAKALLLDLHNNDETFHPEDDATDINWNTTIVSPLEAAQLNKLMADIYNVAGNDGRHTALLFDPCDYLTILDNGWHLLDASQFNSPALFQDIISGEFQGDVDYTIGFTADPYSTGIVYILRFSQDGSMIADYEYNDRKEAVADVLAMKELAHILLTEV